MPVQPRCIQHREQEEPGRVEVGLHVDQQDASTSQRHALEQYECPSLNRLSPTAMLTMCSLALQRLGSRPGPRASCSPRPGGPKPGGCRACCPCPSWCPRCGSAGQNITPPAHSPLGAVDLSVSDSTHSLSLSLLLLLLSEEAPRGGPRPLSLSLSSHLSCYGRS